MVSGKSALLIKAYLVLGLLLLCFPGRTEALPQKWEEKWEKTLSEAKKEGVDPIFIPVPGEKMRWQTQESYSQRPKLLEALKVIMKEVEKK